MDPTRDLGVVADLIEEAFASEIDERGRAALREMRIMARLSPLVWWWSQADPAFSEAFGGFVWEEPNLQGMHPKVVGNVSLSRAPGNRKQSIVCNIVVQKPFRRRGIARQLTQAAIQEAKDRGDTSVLLQVHQDNKPALHLYLSLGFQELAGETTLMLDAASPVAILDAPGYHLRASRAMDGKAIYELARQTKPSAVQSIEPVRASDHWPLGWTRIRQGLARWWTGRQQLRLSALQEERIIGAMVVTTALKRGTHKISLLIHPDHQGALEPAFISRALYTLAALPARPIKVVISCNHDSASRVLRNYGFTEQRTLLTLCRKT